jgi:hypothetical protein
VVEDEPQMREACVAIPIELGYRFSAKRSAAK